MRQKAKSKKNTIFKSYGSKMALAASKNKNTKIGAS